MATPHPKSGFTRQAETRVGPGGVPLGAQAGPGPGGTPPKALNIDTCPKPAPLNVYRHMYSKVRKAHRVHAHVHNAIKYVAGMAIN